MTIIKQPKAKQIRKARLATGQTQTEAAALVHVTLRTWQAWEQGIASMPLGLWELWTLKQPTPTAPPSGGRPIPPQSRPRRAGKAPHHGTPPRHPKL